MTVVTAPRTCSVTTKHYASYWLRRPDPIVVDHCHDKADFLQTQQQQHVDMYLVWLLWALYNVTTKWRFTDTMHRWMTFLRHNVTTEWRYTITMQMLNDVLPS